jgi:hypothetical protein
LLKISSKKKIICREHNGPSIEDYIKWIKSKHPIFWCLHMPDNLKDDAMIWSKFLNYSEMMALSNKEFEKVLLDRWFHVKKNDTESTKVFVSCDNSIL